MTTDILLKKAKDGNLKAFEKLIIPYEKYIYNIAYKMLYNPEDAKDISQEILIKIYKNIGKCNDTGSMKAWIGKIASNACIDELRKRKGKNTLSLDAEIDTDEGFIEREQASDIKTPEDFLIQKESMNDIQEALNTLPPDYKTLVVMRDIYGYSYNEMSESTGTNIGTVKSRLNRARIRLRDILKNQKRGTKGE